MEFIHCQVTLDINPQTAQDFPLVAIQAGIKSNSTAQDDQLYRLGVTQPRALLHVVSIHTTSKNLIVEQKKAKLSETYWAFKVRLSASLTPEAVLHSQ